MYAIRKETKYKLDQELSLSPEINQSYLFSSNFEENFEKRTKHDIERRTKNRILSFDLIKKKNTEQVFNTNDNKECTFEPKINTISKKMNCRSYKDLFEWEKQKKEKLEQVKEQNQGGHTFRPELSKKVQKMKNRELKSIRFNGAMANEQHKEQILKDHNKELTFQPELTHNLERKEQQKLKQNFDKKSLRDNGNKTIRERKSSKKDLSVFPDSHKKGSVAKRSRKNLLDHGKRKHSLAKIPTPLESRKNSKANLLEEFPLRRNSLTTSAITDLNQKLNNTKKNLVFGNESFKVNKLPLAVLDGNQDYQNEISKQFQNVLSDAINDKNQVFEQYCGDDQTAVNEKNHKSLMYSTSPRELTPVKITKPEHPITKIFINDERCPGNGKEGINTGSIEDHFQAEKPKNPTKTNVQQVTFTNDMSEAAELFISVKQVENFDKNKDLSGETSQRWHSNESCFHGQDQFYNKSYDKNIGLLQKNLFKDFDSFPIKKSENPIKKPDKEDKNHQVPVEKPLNNPNKNPTKSPRESSTDAQSIKPSFDEELSFYLSDDNENKKCGKISKAASSKKSGVSAKNNNNKKNCYQKKMMKHKENGVLSQRVANYNKKMSQKKIESSGKIDCPIDKDKSNDNSRIISIDKKTKKNWHDINNPPKEIRLTKKSKPTDKNAIKKLNISGILYKDKQKSTSRGDLHHNEQKNCSVSKSPTTSMVKKSGSLPPKEKKKAIDVTGKNDLIIEKSVNQSSDKKRINIDCLSAKSSMKKMMGSSEVPDMCNRSSRRLTRRQKTANQKCRNQQQDQEELIKIEDTEQLHKFSKEQEKVSGNIVIVNDTSNKFERVRRDRKSRQNCHNQNIQNCHNQNIQNTLRKIVFDGNSGHHFKNGENIQAFNNEVIVSTVKKETIPKSHRLNSDNTEVKGFENIKRNKHSNYGNNRDNLIKKSEENFKSFGTANFYPADEDLMDELCDPDQEFVSSNQKSPRKQIMIYKEDNFPDSDRNVIQNKIKGSVKTKLYENFVNYDELYHKEVKISTKRYDKYDNYNENYERSDNQHQQYESDFENLVLSKKLKGMFEAKNTLPKKQPQICNQKQKYMIEDNSEYDKENNSNDFNLITNITDHFKSSNILNRNLANGISSSIATPNSTTEAMSEHEKKAFMEKYNQKKYNDVNKALHNMEMFSFRR